MPTLRISQITLAHGETPRPHMPPPTFTGLQTSDAKFEPGGPALGPKSGPAELLPGLDASRWNHAAGAGNDFKVEGARS